MFQGLRTVIYDADDLPKTKAWFTKVVGKKPYFDQPFYVGFNVGGYELGLDPANGKVAKSNASTAYWGVPDASKAVKELVKLGATIVDDVKDVGEGIKVAKVRSPFGHVIGVIENPNFKVD